MYFGTLALKKSSNSEVLISIYLWHRQNHIPLYTNLKKGKGSDQEKHTNLNQSTLTFIQVLFNNLLIELMVSKIQSDT
jgi:galactitol-specific phosphotransferase system IIC component